MKKHHKLTNKLLITNLISFTSFLIIWGILSFSLLRYTMTQQRIDDIGETISSKAEYLRLYGTEITRTALSIASVVDYFSDEEQIKSALVSFRNESSSLIKDIIYVVDSEHIYASRTHILEITSSQETYLQFYNNARESAYKGIMWSEPYVSPLSLRTTCAIYTQTSSGHVVICELDSDNLGKSVASSQNNYYWTVSSKENNTVWTDAGSILGGDSIPFENIRNTIFIKTCITIGGENYVVKTQKVGTFDWSISVLIPERLITKAILPPIYCTVFFGILIIATMTLLSVRSGKQISLPLTALAEKLKSAEQITELDVAEECKRPDEIGDLASSIFDMIKRIKELLEHQDRMGQEQRMLEIKMLQAQIHPHFLGNTLTCIASNIKEKNYDESYNSVVILTKLLHYSISAVDEAVSLKDELQATINYLDLRLMRSPDLFDYVISVPEMHQIHTVPRLIIQPIVENAITHGFQDHNKKYEINIVSYELKGNLMLSISNNGLPIDQKKVDMINEGKISPSSNSHGIGVYNVFRRLSLACPGSKGGYIQTTSDLGAIVILDLGAIN